MATASQEIDIGEEVSQLKALATRIKQIPVNSREDIKRALLFKHKSLTKASVAIKVNYIGLSHTIHGRIHYADIIQALQKDLNITDDQVLEFWPLLRTWPKKKQQESSMIEEKTDIRRSLMFKYKSLGKAAEALGVKYNFLSNVIHGRHYTVYVIQAIQNDLNSHRRSGLRVLATTQNVAKKKQQESNMSEEKMKQKESGDERRADETKGE